VSASTFEYFIRWPVCRLSWLNDIFSLSDVAGYNATGQVTSERCRKPFQFARGAMGTQLRFRASTNSRRTETTGSDRLLGFERFILAIETLEERTKNRDVQPLQLHHQPSLYHRAVSRGPPIRNAACWPRGDAGGVGLSVSESDGLVGNPTRTGASLIAGPRCFRETFLLHLFPAPIPSPRRSGATRQPMRIRHSPARPIPTG
jgi:hypothetical protein